MWEKIRVIFTIPELRKKIFFTLALLLVYRVGWQIPLPIIDQTKMTAFFGNQSNTLGQVFQQVAVFSAAQLNQITIFGLGIMPYISASIIFQLLGSVWPPLEKLQKEGESGRKKINEYTRYATVVLCLGQSYVYLNFLTSNSLVLGDYLTSTGSITWGWTIVTVLTMTTGTVFLMWLGEQIDEFGIGNGISLLIMSGILAGMPGAMVELFQQSEFELGASAGGKLGIEVLILLVFLFLAVVAGVVFITLGQRRIPTQSAKHVRGRRVYGGTRQYLPLRVNQANVMPIIFASSLLMFPNLIFSYLARLYPNVAFWNGLNEAFTRGNTFVYNVVYVALIYFFCYFWTAITFNPKDIAENLKNFGTFIPGHRPGRPTANYLEKVMERITYVGAGFLALVAVTPTIVAGIFSVPFQVASFFGGTGLLIAVSVAFDLVQKIDSHLVMRNYRGLLEKG
jgi:preprotein translocase subunit SecY